MIFSFGTSHSQLLKLNYYYIVWTKILQTETTPGEERLLLQSTRKIECKAHVEMKSYPEFAISQAEREGLSKWKLTCLQEEKIKMIKENIEAKRTVETTTSSRYQVMRHIQHTQLVRLVSMLRSYIKKKCTKNCGISCGRNNKHQ